MKETDTRTTWRWWLKALLAILWAFLLAGGYIWAHNPLAAQILGGLGETLASVAVWLGITWLGSALGQRLLGTRLAPAEGETGDGANHLALVTGLGLGALSLLVWGLGMAGLFHPWAAWLLLLALALLLRRDLRHMLALARALRLPRPQSPLEKFFLLYALLVLLLAGLKALAPPTGFDSLVYHLTAPQLYLEAGRIVHPLDLPHLGFPQLGQMHFTLGMLLVGDGPAALFHFGYGLLAVVVTAALARTIFGREAAWFAAVILLSVPIILSLLSAAYVDVTLLFYATAAVYAFLRWRAAHRRGAAATVWLVALGLFSGFGGGVKYTAVLIPVALGLSLIWVSRRDGWVAIVRRLALVALLAGAAVLPWVLENWLTTGNPVYPFFFDNALYWDEWRGWWYDRPGTGLAYTAPWRLLFVPLEASILGTTGSAYYDATIGPLLLLSAGLLALVWPALEREEKRLSGHLLLFFLLNYLLWFAGVARTKLLIQGRLLIFVFGVVAVLGGGALARLPHLRRPQLDVNWLVRTVLVGVLALTLFTQALLFLDMNPLPVAAGLESEDAFLTRRLGEQWQATKGVNRLPAGSQVVFLWAARNYPCAVECWPDAILDRFLHDTHYYGYDAGDLAAAWRAEGFTHVLLNQAGLNFILEEDFDPVTERDLAILEELQAEYLQTVAVWDNDYYLYRLKP